MMDMPSSGQAVAMMLVLIGIIAIGFAVFRVVASRAERGDHPGDSGYDPEDHRVRG